MFIVFLSDLEFDLLHHLLEEGHIHLLEVVIKRFSFITETDKSSLKVSISTAEQMKPEELSDEEKQIIKLLPERGLHIDSIVGLIDWPSSKVAKMLLQLEFKGVIIVLPGKMYKRA